VINLGLSMMADDSDALVRLAGESANGPVTYAVELGTWTGQTACRLSEAGCTVLCVDTFTGTLSDPQDETCRRPQAREKILAAFKTNVGRRLGKTIFVLPMETVPAATYYPDAGCDFLFIDADHRYEAVRGDLLAWSPKVRRGGIIACHDYGAFDGVTRAVDGLGVGVQRAGRSVAWWRV
jgi:predicted O-methyltransferase YrrM